MKFYFLTTFPELIEPYLKSSILGKALDKGLFEAEIINIRDFSKSKHHNTDDYPYGGGAGMLMMPQPLFDAIRSIENYKDAEIIYMTPSGETFDQQESQALYENDKDIIFICGHYEGVDQRVIDTFVTKELSVGDYVLTGGELPALTVLDAVVRHIPEVLGNSSSLSEESFSTSLLEYPQYTRPSDFEGQKVPDVLLSGHFAKIEEWRKNKAIEKTKEIRPDLYEKYLQTQHD